MMFATVSALTKLGADRRCPAFLREVIPEAIRQALEL